MTKYLKSAKTVWGLFLLPFIMEAQSAIEAFYVEPESNICLQGTDAAVINGGSVSFHVTNDDKDVDTNVSVYIKYAGATVAQWSGVNGLWSDNTDHGPYNLTVVTSIDKNQLLSGGQVIILEAPNGHDEWHFNFSISLNFSDGTTTRFDWEGGNLDYDRTTLVRSFH